MSRWLGFVVVASLASSGIARAQPLDFTIANFSNAALELFEIRNGRADLVLRVESWRCPQLQEHGRDGVAHQLALRPRGVQIRHARPHHDRDRRRAGNSHGMEAGNHCRLSSDVLAGASARRRVNQVGRANSYATASTRWRGSCRRRPCRISGAYVSWLDLDAGKWAGAFYATIAIRRFERPRPPLRRRSRGHVSGRRLSEYHRAH